MTIKSLIQNLNIVIGCTIGCVYCYARNNCRRFHTIPDFSKPEYFPSKLSRVKQQKPHIYLMTGTSDLSDWKPEWKEEIFAEMKANPQHRYIFLTKRPEKVDIKTDDENVWLGVTITRNSESDRIKTLMENTKSKHYHITFEPMFDEISNVDLTNVDWVVIGTETGNRKGKSVTKIEWVNKLVAKAKALDTPIFMKEDLETVVGKENMIQELPQEFRFQNS